MNRALLVALVAVVAGALIWGFSIVGGPGFARMEKNDSTRVRDLLALGRHYRCVNDRLTESDKDISPRYCSNTDGPAPELSDPRTGAPYRYTKESETYFEVCATFEVPETHRRVRTTDNIVYDGQNGCITYFRDDSTDKWRLGPQVAD